MRLSIRRFESNLSTAMRKIGLCLCLLAVGLSACQYTKRVPKTTILTGEVVHLSAKSPSAVQVWLTDPVFGKKHVCMLDSAGKFTAQADLLFSQDHVLQYGDESILFFATPGDSIHITIDASRLNRHHEGISFSGDHQVFNNAFNRCALHMDSLMPSLPSSTSNIPIDTLCARMEKDIQRLKEALHTYAQAQNLPKELVRHLEIDLTYRIAELYSGPREDISSDSARQNRYRMYRIASFSPDNPKQFESIHYPIYLTRYCQALIEARLPESTLQGPRLTYLTEAAKLIAAEEKATLCRDYMLYQLIWSLREEPGVEDLLPNLTFLFTNAYIADYLSAQVRQAQNPQAPSTIKNPLQSLTRLDAQKHPETLSGQDFFEYLRANHPGEVVYITLYSTQDDSCRQELLHSGPLHRHYIGKAVLFANLCLDSEYRDWLPTVRRLGIEGENYFVNMAESESLRNLYRIKELPAFLLMDPQGNLVEISATPPSQWENLSRQIDALLPASESASS